jgi:hypothetical protein
VTARVTVACAAALVPDANHLAMVLGQSAADARTYAIGAWQDGNGNPVACASFLARTEWLEGAQSALVRPAWDTDQSIDMTAAARAQAALDLSPGVQAGPGKLAVIIGLSGADALAAMGVTQ